MERRSGLNHSEEAGSQETMTAEQWCRDFLIARERGIEANCYLMEVGTKDAKEKAIRLGEEVVRILEKFPVGD